MAQTNLEQPKIQPQMPATAPEPAEVNEDEAKLAKVKELLEKELITLFLGHPRRSHSSIVWIQADLSSMVSLRSRGLC